MERSDQIGELMTALSVAQLEFEEVKPTRVGRVRKDGGWVAYKYPDLANCIKATRPALAKHGLTVSQPRSLTDDGENVVCTILCHGKSGQWIIGQSKMIPRNPGNPQEIGTTVTYDRRYSYSSIVGLYVEGEDNDAEEPEEDANQLVIEGDEIRSWISQLDESKDYKSFLKNWQSMSLGLQKHKDIAKRVSGWQKKFPRPSVTESPSG